MKSKIIGGILLIMGTSIGAGMLALPLTNASAGFWHSSIYLLLGWALMTLGALYVLEVNLYLKPGHHMLTMAQQTLGQPGLILCFLSYICLLYTLLCAYIAGGTDVISGLMLRLGFSLPDSLLSILFTLALGLIVFGGIRQVDLFNRALMLGKFFAFFLLVLLIYPWVEPARLYRPTFETTSENILVILTSFGFAIIVPNLRTYFSCELSTLKKVILWGSLIPLICYLAWDYVILGSLPAQGPQGVIALNHAAHPTSALSTLLVHTLKQPIIHSLFNFFTSVCMLTAFLSVALALQSFLSDGLKLSHQGHEPYLLFGLTFSPPLLINIFFPGLYIKTLAFAGILCLILLLFLPALMAYKGRNKFTAPYVVRGGQFLQLMLMGISLFIIAFSLYNI